MNLNKEARRSLNDLKNVSNEIKCQLVYEENDQRLKEWITNMEKYLNSEKEKMKKTKCQIM
jgi:molecular chaperone DnaK (HSP70)